MKVFVTNLITFLVDGGSQAQSIFSVLLNYVFALFIFIKWFSSGQMHFIPSWCCLWDCFLLNILIPFPWWHRRGRPASGAWRSYLILSWKSMHIELSTLSAAAAAKSLQSCLTLCDPIDGSPSGSPSLGFSRQEHWSGLPFPSPRHESEKWKWSLSVVSDSSRPHGLQPTRLLCPWDSPGKSTGVGCHCLLHTLYPVPLILKKFSPKFAVKINMAERHNLLFLV